MMKSAFVLFLALGMVACQNNSANTSANIDLTGYETESLKGATGQYVRKLGNNGNLVEEGFVSNGLREGAWITYTPEGQVKTVTTYVGGQVNGIFLEFDNQYRLVSKTGYKNNDFHGVAKKFKFNRVIEELPYNNGKLEGLYKKYFENNGKLQIEAMYSNGVQDGIMRYYNSEGRPTMEYTYKNGEQVSGGIVKNPPVEAE